MCEWKYWATWSRSCIWFKGTCLETAWNWQLPSPGTGIRTMLNCLKRRSMCGQGLVTRVFPPPRRWNSIECRQLIYIQAAVVFFLGGLALDAAIAASNFSSICSFRFWRSTNLASSIPSTCWTRLDVCVIRSSVAFCWVCKAKISCWTWLRNSAVSVSTLQSGHDVRFSWLDSVNNDLLNLWSGCSRNSTGGCRCRTRRNICTNNILSPWINGWWIALSFWINAHQVLGFIGNDRDHIVTEC